MSALYPQVHSHAQRALAPLGPRGLGGATTPQLFQMLMFRSVRNKKVLQRNSLESPHPRFQPPQQKQANTVKTDVF